MSSGDAWRGSTQTAERLLWWPVAVCLGRRRHGSWGGARAGSCGFGAVLAGVTHKRQGFTLTVSAAKPRIQGLAGLLSGESDLARIPAAPQLAA